jgi:hypothetical protein
MPSVQWRTISTDIAVPTNISKSQYFPPIFFLKRKIWGIWGSGKMPHVWLFNFSETMGSLWIDSAVHYTGDEN